VEDHSNDAGVEKAKGVAADKLGVSADKVSVLSAEKQVVAGGLQAAWVLLCRPSAFCFCGLHLKMVLREQTYAPLWKHFSLDCQSGACAVTIRWLPA
jgi:hypothetical protein